MSSNNPVIQHEVILYQVQYNVMYKYTFYHALYSVRVSISHYVLHIAMLVLLIDYSNKYKAYASEPYLPVHSLVSCSSKYKYNRVYFGTICTKSRVSFSTV